jgi:hypothetical protein
MNARTATKAYRIFDETKRHETKFRFFGFAKQAKFCHTKVFFRWFCFSWNYKKDHRIETVRGMSTGNWTQSRLLTFPLLFISVDCPRMESCYSGHSFCYLYDLYERGCFICYLYDLYGRGCVYLLSIWSLWEGLRLSAIYMISMGVLRFSAIYMICMGRVAFICYLYDLYGRGCVYLLSIWSLWEGLRLLITTYWLPVKRLFLEKNFAPHL